MSAIIKPQVSDPGVFLHAHLKKDLQHLIRCLGKGTDDTISMVHLLINSFLEPHAQQKGKKQPAFFFFFFFAFMISDDNLNAKVILKFCVCLASAVSLQRLSSSGRIMLVFVSPLNVGSF